MRKPKRAPKLYPTRTINRKTGEKPPGNGITVSITRKMVFKPTSVPIMAMVWAVSPVCASLINARRISTTEALKTRSAVRFSVVSATLGAQNGNRNTDKPTRQRRMNTKFAGVARRNHMDTINRVPPDE
jgi:hypothetical protein